MAPGMEAARTATTALAAMEATPSALTYLEQRELRIQENERKLAEMGLIDMSKELASSISSELPRRRKSSISSKPGDDAAAAAAGRPVLPSRRSSRLSGTTPVSYSELSEREVRDGERRGRGGGHGVEDAGRGGPRPEVYTAAHALLLGSCSKEWELFVDGYTVTKDGDRIRVYDSARGKTCHQCRQKTLGHRTSCSRCKSLHGEFCGDCLFMRYGENVMEAKENTEWVCPVCRDICNCSFCRNKKGWAPTGTLYRKIKALKYKSVAHYLILTRMEKEDAAGDNNMCDSNKEGHQQQHQQQQAETSYPKSAEQEITDDIVVPLSGCPAEDVVKGKKKGGEDEEEGLAGGDMVGVAAVAPSESDDDKDRQLGRRKRAASKLVLCQPFTANQDMNAEQGRGHSRMHKEGKLNFRVIKSGSRGNTRWKRARVE